MHLIKGLQQRLHPLRFFHNLIMLLRGFVPGFIPPRFGVEAVGPCGSKGSCLHLLLAGPVKFPEQVVEFVVESELTLQIVLVRVLSDLLLCVSDLLFDQFHFSLRLRVSDLYDLLLSFAVLITDYVVELLKQSLSQFHVPLLICKTSGVLFNDGCVKRLTYPREGLDLQHIKAIHADSLLPIGEPLSSRVPPLLSHLLGDLSLHFVLFDEFGHGQQIQLTAFSQVVTNQAELFYEVSREPLLVQSSLFIMSQVNFSSRKPIQPLFPYVDRSIENILAEVERKLEGTGINAESIEPYLFEDELRTERLTVEQKAVISNKVDRLVSYYTAPSVHNIDSGMMRAKRNKLLCFRSKEVEVKNPDKDFEHQFQKVIMSYRSDLDKIVSNKYNSFQSFCFNHFVNYREPIEIKDRNGVRALNVNLWNFDFETALYCLSHSSPEHPDKMDTQLLTTVIRIFQNIKAVVSRDPQLVKRFCKRETPNILQKEEVGSDVSIPFTFLTGEITENQLAAISNLSLGTKVLFLKKCMDFATDLAKQMAEIAKGELDKKNNCYIPFLFLSNDLQTPNYGLILDHPHLQEVDKFFFAFKFLPNTKFQEYKIKLKKRLEVSSNLQELGLCNSIESQSKIMQNYIDETGDIKTIAILVLYEKEKIGFDKRTDLDIFIEKYKNILTEFNQQVKLEEFKNKEKELRERYRQNGGGNTRKQSSQSLELFELGDSFLSRIDLDSKKIKSSIPRRDNLKFFCWICRMNSQEVGNKSKVFAQDFYVECEKCRHGGHLKHLNIWFQNNIRCPVPDCSCCCN